MITVELVAGVKTLLCVHIGGSGVKRCHATEFRDSAYKSLCVFCLRFFFRLIRGDTSEKTDTRTRRDAIDKTTRS